MKFRTLKQIKNLKGKRVLLRVDFNVPIKSGRVADDTRIRETLPTIKYLLKKKAIVIIVSHLGRPDGKRISALKLDPIAKRLQTILKKRVIKLDDCIGPKVAKTLEGAEPDSVYLLENVRFHAAEEKNDKKFSKALARLADIFVSDSFGTAHRAHSSTVGIAAYLPAYAGFLLEKEIAALTPLLKQPKKPLAVIVGGAKIDTKIGIIKSFFEIADYILIGGGLANTFLAAEGYDIAKSFYEPKQMTLAQEIMMKAAKYHGKLLLPTDAIVADTASEKAQTVDLPLEDIEGNMRILDIGSKTLLRYIAILRGCKTVIWNGPVGFYEFTPFILGTKVIARTLVYMKKHTKVYIGGGDTVDALTRLKIPPQKFTHVSTGGGAMLEFLEGKKLPGVKILYR